MDLIYGTAAAVFSLFLSGLAPAIATGLLGGISLRITNTIAGKTIPRRRKSKGIFKKFVLFIILTIVFYGIFKFLPLILAFIL